MAVKTSEGRACACTQPSRTRTVDLVFVDVWLECDCAVRCRMTRFVRRTTDRERERKKIGEN